MADLSREQQQRPATEDIKSLLQKKSPTASQAISVAALLPLGGILLALAGITLTITVIGLALATPLFVICSPVLVPAAIVIGLAVTGFLASGVFGLTGLTSLTWIANYLRGARTKVPEQMEYMKRRMAETAGQGMQQVGQRAREAGQGIQQKAQG